MKSAIRESKLVNICHMLKTVKGISQTIINHYFLIKRIAILSSTSGNDRQIDLRPNDLPLEYH